MLSAWPSSAVATCRSSSAASSGWKLGPSRCAIAATRPATRADPLNPNPRPIGIDDRTRSWPVPPSRRKARTAGWPSSAGLLSGSSASSSASSR
jgi:hypothetical protein